MIDGYVKKSDVMNIIINAGTTGTLYITVCDKIKALEPIEVAPVDHAKKEILCSVCNIRAGETDFEVIGTAALVQEE